MLGRLIRLLLAVTAIAPLSISMAYIYASQNNLQLAAIAACTCILFGATAMWIIKNAQQRLERLPITIKKAKSADKEVIGFFVAYALPLLFRGQSSSPDIGAWLIAACMLLFVLWSTHSLQVNPVLGLFGYHFYEVETADGITYLLITKRRINNALAIKQVVQVSEYGIVEAQTKTKLGGT